MADMQPALMAALLRRGRGLDWLSTALTVLALGYGLAPLLGLAGSRAGAMFCGVLVLLGVVEKYFAVRVALDADLFAALAADPSRLDERTLALDQALVGLALQPPRADTRPWDDRCRGALRLLRKQVLWLVAQLALVIVAACVLGWRAG